MSLAATVTMVLMLVLLAGLVIVLSGMQAGLPFMESKVEVRAELNDGVVLGARSRSCSSRSRRCPRWPAVSYQSARTEALEDFEPTSSAADGRT